MLDNSLQSPPARKVLVVKTAMALVGITNLTLTVLFLENLGSLAFYCAVCGFSLLFAAAVVLPKTDAPIYKLLVFLNMLALTVIVFYVIMRETGLLEKVTDAEVLRKMIVDSGAWGIVVLFLLTLFQVVVLPIPAAVTILLGVFVYGPTVSFIVSTLGTIIGSAICFMLGKVFGYRIVSWIIGSDKAKKYSLLISEKGKIPFIAMMIFPFFPDDILCMAAGLTKMTFKFFLITVSLTRPIMIAFLSYFGMGEIIPFRGWGIPVWISIIVFGVFLLYLVNFIIKKRRSR